MSACVADEQFVCNAGWENVGECLPIMHKSHASVLDKFMEEVSSGRSTSCFMVCLRMTLVLLQLQNLKTRGKQTWKEMLRL